MIKLPQRYVIWDPCYKYYLTWYDNNTAEFSKTDLAKVFNSLSECIECAAQLSYVLNRSFDILNLDGDIIVSF